MQIRWEEDALADLTALRDYIAQDNPAAAQKLARRILECLELLDTHPLSGEPGRIHKTRELVVSRTPYTLIYHASADVITILRVFHQSRQWPEKL
jgi:toxin ParE1/3/4